MAPYRFGINQEWLDQERNNYPALTEDYGKHSDPDGFGENAYAYEEGGDEDGDGGENGDEND